MFLYALAVVVNECPCIIFRLYQYSSNIMFNHFLGELYEEVKVKDTHFSSHVLRACKGRRGIVQCHSPITFALDGALCPSHFYLWGKSHHYLLYRKLGRSKRQSGYFGEEKNLLPLLGFKRWIVQPYWMQYHSCHKLYEMSQNKVHINAYH